MTRKRPTGIQIVPWVHDVTNVFNQEACATIRRARELSRLPPAQFAKRLSDLLGRGVSLSELTHIEAGEGIPMGSAVFAAVQLSGQSADVCAGTHEIWEITLPEVERQVSDLRALVEEALPSKASRKLSLLPRSRKDAG